RIEGVHPAAPVAAVRADVAVVPIDEVALVLLQQLIGRHWIARLGTGVDVIEHLRLAIEIEAEALEVLIPVRVLDDHLDVRVDAASRPEDHVLRHVPHLAQPVLGPALRALGADVRIAARVVEGEVIEHHGIEMARRHAHGALGRCDVLRILVIERAERAALVGRGERDASIDADAACPEEARDPPERGRIGEYAAAVLLEVHLVEMHLAPDALELLREHFRVRELPGRGYRDVDGDPEIPVGPLRRHGEGGVAPEQQRRRGDRAEDPGVQELTHQALPAPLAHEAHRTWTAAPEYLTVLSAGAVKSSPGRPLGDIQRMWNARLCCMPGNYSDQGERINLPVAWSYEKGT